MKTIQAQPLNAQSFAPFGDVIEAVGPPDKLINQGLCERFHDRAKLDFGADARGGISMFRAEPRSLPYTVDLLERHPEGSQAFVPLSQEPFLVIAARDDNCGPAEITAFLSNGQQAINFHKNTWHGVLTPLSAPGLFAVIDRIGNTPNLEEHWLDAPVLITR